MNYGALLLTYAISFSPAITAALISSRFLFKIMHRQSKIVSPVISDKNEKPDTAYNFVFQDIDFHYPTRPDIQILKKFNLEVEEGKTVALVGLSGSGKSSTIALFERFYSAQRGHIYIGNDEISTDITLNDLRAKICIVSQEPVLFDRTIAENIAYGCDENEISMADVIEAAKMANVHTFIASLPQVGAN